MDENYRQYFDMGHFCWLCGGVYGWLRRYLSLVHCRVARLNEWQFLGLQAPVSGTQASFQPASQQPQVATPAAQSAVMPPGAVVNPAPAPAGNQTSVNPAGNQPSTAASPARRPGSYRELLREQAQQSKGP